MEVDEFVLSHLPAAPARVLEVGCGRGELAGRIAAKGFDVTAIDPIAPTGPMFRRTTLEELSGVEPFDAAVANHSLHHMHHLPTATDKLAGILRPAGVLVINELAWERLDLPTAAWLLQRRQAGAEQVAPSVDDVLAEWRREHEGLHTSSAMHAALKSRFDEIVHEFAPYLARFERTPYLARERDDAEGEREEEVLIAGGTIRACGWRWVGGAAAAR